MRMAKVFKIVMIVFACIIGSAIAADYHVNSVSIDAPRNVNMGTEFTVKASVDSNSPNVRLTLSLPSGLELKSGEKYKELNGAKEYTWNVIARKTGVYNIGVRATDSVETKSATKTVSVDFNRLNIIFYTSKTAVRTGETFTVSGTVKDYDGNAISDADMKIEVGGRTFTAKSGSNGAFSVDVSSGRTGNQVVSVTATKVYLSNTATKGLKVTGTSITTNTLPVGYDKKLTVKVYDTVRKNAAINADTICANGVCFSNANEHTFNVGAGSVTVEVRKNGYTAYAATVNVNGNTDYSVYLTPTSTRGNVEVFVKSFDTNENLQAKIVLSNGQVYEANGLVNANLPIGVHTVTIIAPGYKSQSRVIEVTPAGTTLAAFSLEKANEKAPKSQDMLKAEPEQASNAIVWILWISAIASIIALLTSCYWIYFRNPVKEAEGF